MTIFEPKYHFSALYKTDSTPLSHTACLNIDGLKSYLKDSPVRLDLTFLTQKLNRKIIFQKIKI